MPPRPRRERLLRLERTAGRETWLSEPGSRGGERLPISEARAIVRRVAFGGSAERASLLRLARERSGAGSELDAWRRLDADLAAGRLELRSLPISLPVITPGVLLEPPTPPVPLADDDEIVEDTRALMITRCDPELLSPDPLKYSYLIRGLGTAKLRITSASFPGELVHEADLPAGETSDGVHDAQWDGKVTAPGDYQDKRLRGGFSPAKLAIIHDDVFFDDATFVIGPSVIHGIDVEDSHFNHDRSVLLPDLASVDGSTPTLDERRITGLGVIHAALAHAEANPEQKVLVVGHADPSGAESYNQTLSETRAENVHHFLFGDRDGWRNHAHAHAHDDDIRLILEWQATRAGWDCHPGSSASSRRAAVGRFQERYNQEVQRTADEGLDLPYRAAIGVDNEVGPETWGAFFDVYMHELVRLAGVEGVSAIEAKMAALTQFNALPKFIGCGEHIPFSAGRREPFEPDEAADRPQHSAADRRVELLFFDEDEEPDLVCHAGGAGHCDPSACPLYTTGEYRHREIGVPRGLPIAEVVIALKFEDPGGEVHGFPVGMPVEIQFSDGSTQSVALIEGSLVQFVTARDKPAFALSIAPGEARHLTLVPGEDGADPTFELLDRDAAIGHVDAGGRFLKLPERFDTRDCVWRVPPEVAFVEGEFTELDDPATQIGTRAAPAEVVLVPRWQHFRFDFFDRWRLRAASVPQPRPRSTDTRPLILEGHLRHADYETGPSDPPLAESVWDLVVGDQTLHCVAWVQNQVPPPPAPAAPPDPAAPPPDPAAPPADPAAPPAEPIAIPDADCLVRFVFPKSTFVRTAGEPDASEVVRTIETIGSGHEHHDEASKAGLARLRHYDLPVEWWSRGYFARMGSQTPADRKRFAELTTPSTKDDPFVIDLDDLVMCLHADTLSPYGPPRDDNPLSGYTWEDADGKRFTLWNAELAAHKPIATETYFTDVAQLQPPPQGAVVLDHPPFTRLITRGSEVFDVFDHRTPRAGNYQDLPIGARAAIAYRSDHDGPFYFYAPQYSAPRADDSNPPSYNVGDIPTIVLRCCGRDGARELFRVVQYAPAFFDFNPSAPASGHAIVPAVPAATAIAEARDCLIATAKRWNGQDAINGNPPIFEIGPADAPIAKGPFHALLVRGVPGALSQYYTINIVDSARAFMSRVCTWERADMRATGTGRFTSAHEWGHAFGNPDHYIENANNASLHADGIRDRFRSPGCPYSFDPIGMMHSNVKVRAYDLWHLALWMADSNHAFAGQTDIAVRQGSIRYTTPITPRNQDRSRFPVISRVNRSVGAAGLCDLFGYAIGVDGFNGGDGLHGATAAAPFDLVVICRVKLAFTLRETDHQEYNGGRLFLAEVQNTIHRIFNRERRLLARGTYAGRSVRARVLFSPRFIVRTFPTGTSAARTKYLTDLTASPNTAAAYTTQVAALITESPIHADVIAVEDPDDHGITNSTATPRRANVDTDDLEDEIVEVFGKLIGMAKPDRDDPEQLRPLVTALAPDFVASSLEFLS
ncbi:OmpA family protein [Nannocystaceae bacterium ST9]